MQQLIGEFIRQLRRQRNLTQTELGAERFSKSYVSAVERNKIVPSLEALRFFAEQLGQTADYFEKLRQEAGGIGASLVRPDFYGTRDQEGLGEVLTLLDVLLEGSELKNFPLSTELPTLSSEAITSLPLHRQARYFFLVGLIAREKGDFSKALYAFEHALALAPAKHHPAILDELGTHHYLAGAYQIALGYHERALHLLQEEVSNEMPLALRLKVELHCANDYRALGAHQQAREHYEHARLYLSSTNDMKTAGQLYLGLGYCSYAWIYQNLVPGSAASGTTRLTDEETDREFQRAVSFLVQSRTLCQVSSDRMGESSARLLEAMVLLDFSTWRRRIAQQRARDTGNSGAPLVVNCATLLDEAEEQCHQVLIGWQDSPTTSEIPVELEVALYMALAYLIRVFMQQAMLARISGYTDTALGELSLASQLSQQVLESLSQPHFPWALIRNTMTRGASGLEYYVASLPRLPRQSSTILRNSMSQAEVYFAAAEVAEELGRAATTADFSQDCYTEANRCFQAALNMTDLAVPDKERDHTYLTRCYQRCVGILEERIQVAPAVSEETTQFLLNILKDALYQPQYQTVL